MTARPLEIRSTGPRPVGLPMAGALLRSLEGARFVRTRQGLALFDDAGRFVGMVRRPDHDTTFGRAGCTVLLRR